MADVIFFSHRIVFPKELVGDGDCPCREYPTSGFQGTEQEEFRHLNQIHFSQMGKAAGSGYFITHTSFGLSVTNVLV